MDEPSDRLVISQPKAAAVFQDIADGRTHIVSVRAHADGVEPAVVAQGDLVDAVERIRS